MHAARPFSPRALLALPCAILRLWQVSQGLLMHFQAYSSYPHRRMCGSPVYSAGLHAALGSQ